MQSTSVNVLSCLVDAQLSASKSTAATTAPTPRMWVRRGSRAIASIRRARSIKAPTLPTVRFGQHSIAFPHRRTLSVVLTVLLVGILGWVAYHARHVILLFIFAIFFAYLVYPVVRFLQRHSLSLASIKGSAVLEVYSVFLALTLVLAHVLVPGLARDVFRLVHEVPTLLNGLSNGATTSDMAKRYGWSEAQEQYAKSFLARHREDVENLVSRADRYLPNLAEMFASLLIIPVLAIFLLRDGANIAKTLIKIVTPETGHEKILALANEMHRVLGAYMRAQVLLCGLALLFYALTLSLMRTSDALALAILGGFLEFVPAIGWMSMAALIIGLAVVNHSHWVWVALILGLWRIFQNYFMSPRILGRELEIHPLAALFAVLVGAEVGGIVGIILAVPLTASLRVIWRIYAAPHRLQQSAAQLASGVKDSSELECENERRKARTTPTA